MAIRKFFYESQPQRLKRWSYKRYLKKKRWKYRPLESQKQHSVLIGGSGSGKSSAIAFFSHTHIASTNKPNEKGKRPLAFSLLEPHQDLSLELLQFSCFAGEGRERLIYLDGDIHTTFKMLFDEDIGHHTFVINPYDVKTYNLVDHNGMVENQSSAFSRMLSNKPTERMTTIIQACTDFLLTRPGSSVEDLMNLMHDGFNQQLCEEGSQIPNRERAQILAELRDNKDLALTKKGIYYRLKQIIGPATVKNKLIGPSTVDMEQAIKDGKVLIYNIGSLGMDSCPAFGKLILGLEQGILRKRQSSNFRKPFYKVIDESDDFMGSNESMATVLTKHRKYGHYHLLALQSITQVSDTSQAEIIMGNTAIKGCGAVDGKTKNKFKSVIPGLTDADFKLPPHTFLHHDRNRRKNQHNAKETREWKVPHFLVWKKNSPFFMSKKELKELLLRTIFDSEYYYPVDPNTGLPLLKKDIDKTRGYIDQTGAYVPNFSR